MGIIRKLVQRGLEFKSHFALNQPKAFDIQGNMLRKLVEKAQDTEFGKKYGFRELYFSSTIIEDFRARVPLSNYSSMQPWWQKAYEGESDVCWPGKTQHFALSSGTSEGSSKYIPVSKDMIKAIRRASMRQVLPHTVNTLPRSMR